jgi:hypothetical protein
MKTTVHVRFAMALTLLLATVTTITSATAAGPVEDVAIAKRLRAGQKKVQTDRQNLQSPVCGFNVSLSCQVHGDNLPSEGTACDMFSPPILLLKRCKQAPLTTTLLYHGGVCSQTDHAKVLGIVCKDGVSASPLTADGDQSYIVVTDAHDKGTIYHDGWVNVGANFVLDDGADVPMTQGFAVNIYDDESKANLLQQVSYSRPLCSSDLELGNRFGASQIVEYTNRIQGKISMFASATYSATLNVTIALTGAKTTASIESLSILTSFAGYLDFTDILTSSVVTRLTPAMVSLPVEVDLLQRLRNTVLIQVSAGRNDQVGVCSDTIYRTFVTGGRMVY